MNAPYNLVVMGASCHSLLAAKLLLAGHAVRLACPNEAEPINEEGLRVNQLLCFNWSECSVINEGVTEPRTCYYVRASLKLWMWIREAA